MQDSGKRGKNGLCRPTSSKKLRKPTRRQVLKYGAYAGLGCGLSSALWISGCGGSKSSKRVNIVFILIDALRKDHLGCYGYGVKTTKNISRLADQAVMYTKVISPSTWTKTSMASIMTGTTPARHGVKGIKDVLPGRLTTIAEVLSRNGYHTVGINTNPWLKSMFGFRQGFNVYGMCASRSSMFARAWAVNQQAVTEMKRRRGRKPLFLYLHYMDVHAPYIPQRPYFRKPQLAVPGVGLLPDARIEYLYRMKGLRGPAVQQRVIDLYDGEIKTADAAVAEIRDELDKLIGLENTLFVITADHGEAFLEHGTPEHGYNLYPEVYSVPLLMLWPGKLQGGTEINAQMRSIDIAPTLLELAGLDIPASFEGKVLPTSAAENAHDRLAVAEVGTNDYIPNLDYAAVVSRGYLYIHERTNNRVEFYDLLVDAGAKKNLGASHPKFGFYAKFEPKAGSEPSGKTELDELTRRQLESLGYLK